MVKETPPKVSIEKFWKEIWGEKNPCNISASWMDREYGQRKLECKRTGIGKNNHT